MAVELNISTWRHVPFGGATGNGDIVVIGADFSTATFAMQIRATPGAADPALVSLVNAAAGSQGISVSYDAAYPLFDGSTAPASTIRIEIARVSIETDIPVAAKPEDPAVCYYDLQVAPSYSGARSEVLAFGSFSVFPGVTDA